jgi:DNA-binding transcriptional LysR family regulator
LERALARYNAGRQAAARGESMDRVSSMISFVKVVEQKGFSSAARQLDLATSVVTTHVKALEDRLGVRLLNRTTRSVSLTEAGRTYYERCVQILSEIEDAEEAAQLLQSKPRGVLRLNTSPGMPPLLASSIAEYNDLYPDVTIRLTVTSRMLDLVEDGLDLAIWFAAVADASLIVRRLASYRLVVCASPEYLAKYGKPKHPSELAEHKSLIFFDATLGKDGRDWLFTGPDGDISVRLSGIFETNSPIALRAAAVLGQGITIGPSLTLSEYLKSGSLVPILRDFLPKQYSVDALYPHREHLPAKVRTFIDLVVKNLRRTDWDDALQSEDSGRPIKQSSRIST